MAKKWVVKQVPELVSDLNGYSPLVNRLLVLRNITNLQDAEKFLNIDYVQLHDPFLFTAMSKAVLRITQAVQQQEKISIYADYDADAITAASVVTLGLRKLGGLVDCYIPDRFTEGYGMNLEAIKALANAGTKLIITVDCGTNSVAEAELCKELGVDLIITDHHEITGNLPNAYALINPKNSADNYPFPYLTGVGVAYKLMQALFSQAPKDVPPGWEKWLLDIVSIGTVADLQSLTDENRVLVKYGLQVLAKTKWPGLRALMDMAQMKAGPLTTHTLGFVLAPRINAAGRIKHADVAYKMLISDDYNEAQKLAQELNDLNSHRQNLTERILSEAREQIIPQRDKKVLLAAGEDWPKGVVGLVAGKLAEEFGKPALVMDKGPEFATGSARSFPYFDIVKALTASKHLLEKYGGHTQAAGFTLKSSNIDELYKNLLDFAQNIAPEDAEPLLEIDARMQPIDYNWDTYDTISRFEPFGFGNLRPKFLGQGMQVVDARTVGADGQHLKLRLMWADKVINAIGFRLGFWATKLQLEKSVDVVFELEANEWNNNKDLQIKIIDLKQE